MDNRNLDSRQNIDALGLGYVYSYLARESYTIFEVNTDPNHHFQIVAKADNQFILVAVRTAYYPDSGSIDQGTIDQLVKDSGQLNAIPYFASLSVTPLETNNLEISGFKNGKEYEIIFNGLLAV